MKHLSQIIATLFNSIGVQLILAFGTVIISLQILVNKISGVQKRWKASRKNRDIADHRWQIE